MHVMTISSTENLRSFVYIILCIDGPFVRLNRISVLARNREASHLHGMYVCMYMYITSHYLIISSFSFFQYIWSVTSLWALMSVRWLCGWSFCYNFLKGQREKVTLPRSYRGTLVIFDIFTSRRPVSSTARFPDTSLSLFLSGFLCYCLILVLFGD